MIYLFGLAFVFAACSANIVDNPSNENNSAPLFFFVGDDDEELTLVDSNEEIDEEFIRSYTGDPDNHGYFLFTRGNPINPQILKYKNENTVENSNFNKDKVTVFLSHGWHGNWKSSINTELTAAFLEVQDVNVIVLDWSALASKGYLTAVKGVPAVGRDLGQFIMWLVSLGASYGKHHIVGFSLGGHVVGNAGRETGGQVKRITALDPAGPLWWSNSERLIKSDAQYVEVIHTSLVCGHITPCGDTDFYPNGGYLQPGCPCVPCSHSRSYKYMAASLIFNNFKANECKNMDEMLNNSCAGEIEIMGNGNLEPKRPGIYRLNTGSHYPYNVTKYSTF